MKIHHRQAGLRAAAFALALCGTALAQAANGFVVTAAEQEAVKVGMSRDEVRDLLGRPAHNVKYRSEPGRTWTYGVADDRRARQNEVFDIDFSPKGLVLSTSRRIEVM